MQAVVPPQSGRSDAGLAIMSSISEESLLAGLAAGDPEAAAAFIGRFQARVYGLALAILHDQQAAEEVAQETFVRAWRYAGAYDARRGRVDTWLLAITKNTANDRRRLRRFEPIDPNVILTLPIPGSGPDPEERSVVADQCRRLRKAVATLPEKQRRALLAALFGYTAREISQSEGIPVGTAKTRIRAALLKLRSLLEVGDER